MDITIIVYGKGNPNLQPFAERGFDWVAAKSGIPLNRIWKFSTLIPTMSQINNAPFLSPQDIDWTEVPPARITVLFWDGSTVAPAYGGATWAPATWGSGNASRLTSVVSIPYDAVGWNEWVPAEGFPSRFEAIIAHEFDNSIVSWANFFGFKNIYTQYEPGAAPGTYVDCSKFPDSASCYTAVLGQLNDDIRSAIESGPIPTTPVPALPPILGTIPMMMLTMFGMVMVSKGVKRGI